MNKQSNITKKCSTCHEYKQADDKHFFPFHMTKDGLMSRCMKCEIERRTIKGKEYLERSKARAKEKAANKKPIQQTEVRQTIKAKPQNETDRLFSLVIRNVHGKFCYNCGKHGEVNEMQCGHWLGRSNFGTRFDLRNALPLCQMCNFFDYTHTERLTKRLIELYGIDVIDELNIKKIERFSPSKGQMEWLEAMLKTLLKSLTDDTERNIQKLIETQKMIDALFFEVV